MADLTDRQHVLPGNAALAALPPAEERSDQPALSPDEVDPADTTSILQGAQAINSKASRNGSWRAFVHDPFGLYAVAKAKKDETDAQQARELANLARWNEQRTVIGGVEMTNEEAQDARQRVIDNGAHYADWAVKQGYIREDEKAEFIEAMRRKRQLEDRRGRGILTPAEEREEAELDRSRMGRGLDAATARAYQDRGPSVSAALRSDTGNALLRSPDPGTDATATAAVFQDYDAAKRVAVAPTPPDKPTRVSATGLDL